MCSTRRVRVVLRRTQKDRTWQGSNRQGRVAGQGRAALIPAVQMMKCAREGQVPDVNPPGSAEEEATLRPVSEQTKVGDMLIS